MTLIFALSGSSGCSDWLSSIAAPLPLAHQWSGLMPLPMNTTAKRLGAPATSLARAAAAIAAVDPKPASDSSHGSAIVTPTPWRTVRRGTALRAAATRLSC